MKPTFKGRHLSALFGVRHKYRFRVLPARIGQIRLTVEEVSLVGQLPMLTANRQHPATS